jgi:hypothetical protein
MKTKCRNVTSGSRRNRELASVLRHVRIVTDPQQLARLHAEADRRKALRRAFPEKH